jgi:hypothetical protein
MIPAGAAAENAIFPLCSAARLSCPEGVRAETFQTLIRHAWNQTCIEPCDYLSGVPSTAVGSSSSALAGKDVEKHRQVARQSCVYALLLSLFFLIFGNLILRLFGVPLRSRCR